MYKHVTVRSESATNKPKEANDDTGIQKESFGDALVKKDASKERNEKRIHTLEPDPRTSAGSVASSSLNLIATYSDSESDSSTTPEKHKDIMYSVPSVIRTMFEETDISSTLTNDDARGGQYESRCSSDESNLGYFEPADSTDDDDADKVSELAVSSESLK